MFRLFPLPEDSDFDLIERGFNALILWARRDSGKGSGSTDLASVTWQLALNMVIKSAFTAGSIFSWLHIPDYCIWDSFQHLVVRMWSLDAVYAGRGL